MEIQTTQTISTRYGSFTIDKVRDKKMAEVLASAKYPNEGLLTIARAFVNKGSVVVDVGAHIGTFAVPIATDVEKVIAFEPSTEAWALLSRNASQNGASLQIINKGLGSERGSGTLLVRNATNAGANTLVVGGDIPVVTLDEEVSHADFIKIDVEGMELEVLLGAARIIERSRPVVFFEVNLSQLRAHGVSPRSLGRFFVQHGYWIYYPLEGNELTFARVPNVTLVTALIAPRSWLFFGESAPFDLIAIPKERTLPFSRIHFVRAVWQIISTNVSIKRKRIKTFLRRIF